VSEGVYATLRDGLGRLPVRYRVAAGGVEFEIARIVFLPSLEGVRRSSLGKCRDR